MSLTLSGFIPVKSPNLPIGRVALAAVGARYSGIAGALVRLGIDLLALGDLPALPEPVRGHADMRLLHIGGGEVVAAGLTTLEREQLCSSGFRLHEGWQLTDRYPGDCALNALILGDLVFCGRGCLPSALGQLLSSERRIVEIKQGYARCSAAVVGPKKIITADRGLYSAASKNGLDALLIPPGEIELPGYGSGFIGGCCGLIGSGRLVFTGSLKSLSYGRLIADYCFREGLEVLELSQGPMLDVGGILPLAEYGPC